MAKKTFHCTVITPAERLLDEEVTYVNIPLHDGLMGILPGRSPILAKLGLGELRITSAEGGDRSYLLEDGFAQMVGDSLTLLAKSAVPVESLSEEEARAELAEANARNATEGDAMRKITRDRDRARLKMRLASSFRSSGAI
ncbi:MAG: F0F1 ATP synthase subunit epsilon [Phycisphaeraceae bacterium]|nr:F0F1 ATP synthase subunit epsilon [Phycisphaeraceae bacterium]